MTLEDSVKELRKAWNELMKCLIYDTFLIKIINKIKWLEVKEQYRRY